MITAQDDKKLVEEEIVIPNGYAMRISRQLDSSPSERVVFLWGTYKPGITKNKRIVNHLLIPADEDYERSSAGNVKVSQDYVNREFPALENRGDTLVGTVHSQPMKHPSGGDLRTHREVVKIYPHQLTGTFCGSELSFYCEDENRMREVSSRIIDIGKYDRQVLAWGEEAQLLISSASVALLAAGGGNWKIATGLAGLGIGNLLICDPDNWEEHNRNRVLVPSNHVGKNKAESIKELIEQHYPDVRVNAYPCRLEEVPLGVLTDYDLLVIGPDNFPSRIDGNRIALKLKRPAIFPAAGIHTSKGKITVMGGSCRVWLPEKQDWPCLECHLQLDDTERRRATYTPEEKAEAKRKYGVELAVANVASIPSLNDVIAGFALWEIEKVLTGIDEPSTFVFYDALAQESGRIREQRNPKCPACGEPVSEDELCAKEEALVEKVRRTQGSRVDVEAKPALTEQIARLPRSALARIRRTKVTKE